MIKPPFKKCGWCKVAPRPASEKYYPPGWELFVWGLKQAPMCPSCLKALRNFLSKLEKKSLDKVAT
jgi:hypothetical protein